MTHEIPVDKETFDQMVAGEIWGYNRYGTGWDLKIRHDDTVRFRRKDTAAEWVDCRGLEETNDLVRWRSMEHARQIKRHQEPPKSGGNEWHLWIWADEFLKVLTGKTDRTEVSRATAESGAVGDDLVIRSSEYPNCWVRCIVAEILQGDEPKARWERAVHCRDIRWIRTAGPEELS